VSNEDGYRGWVNATVPFGPAHLNGTMHSEKGLSYVIHFEDDRGERLGEAARIGADRLGEGCCHPEAYVVQIGPRRILWRTTWLVFVIVEGGFELPASGRVRLYDPWTEPDQRTGTAWARRRTAPCLFMALAVLFRSWLTSVNLAV